MLLDAIKCIYDHCINCIFLFCYLYTHFFHTFFGFHFTFRLKVIGSQSVCPKLLFYIVSLLLLFPWLYSFSCSAMFTVPHLISWHYIPLLPADVGVLRSCLHVQNFTESSFSSGPVFLAQSTSTLTFLNALHKQRVFFLPSSPGNTTLQIISIQPLFFRTSKSLWTLCRFKTMNGKPRIKCINIWQLSLVIYHNRIWPLKTCCTKKLTVEPFYFINTHCWLYF